MKQNKSNDKCSCGGSCGSTEMGKLTRRDFVKLTASSAAIVSGLSALPAMAGPFTSDDLKHLVPSDKRLTSQWIRSLYQRSAPEIYRASRDQLQYIGMPIGGIGCGQLYLGGDGKLWLWDVFKSNYSRERHDMRFDAMTFNGHYTKPIAQGQRYHQDIGIDLEQGFAVNIRSGKKTQSRSIDINGFKDVSFRGEYPIGRVSYADPDCPVNIELEAFSPFIPLNVKDSALPATMLTYTVENKSDEDVIVQLGGWLENKVCPFSDHFPGYLRRNQVHRTDNSTVLHMSAAKNTKQQVDIRDTDNIKNQPGYGSMALTLIGQGQKAKGCAALCTDDPAGHLWTAGQLERTDADFGDRLIGGLATSAVTLKPGQKTTATFAVSWYFPYHPGIEGSQMGAIKNASSLRRYYAKHFDSALDVARYLIKDHDRLAGNTKLWNSVWYDSTLPHWLLDRTFISIDCLATQTSHYFDTGRFWGWEGVDCCPGTCQHVWNYSQANARIFPKIERDQRENVDFGLALRPNGESGHRAENRRGHFTDGQAGTIIRLWREHTISPDPEYLRRVWPKVKTALQFLITHDAGENGILEGAQHNTLDAAWYGPCAWISSVYCAALAAGEQMAVEMGDGDFAKKCRSIRRSGSEKLVSDLFNGEYFINKPDKTKKAINSNIGCHIDQVLGQSWAMQTGLPRIVPKQETVSALNSLWKYNFAPDAGLYDKLHTVIKGARVFAAQGEAGLIMCTWPKGGDDKAVPGMADRVENGVTWLGPGGYFDECMTGFEYQAAAHMIYEGSAVSDTQMRAAKSIDIEKSLVLKGLAITRAVHDRYGPEKRNPYNEIECSDHYSRAMASYGVFLAACGFEYHGPKGYMMFAPRLSPENFKAAFTAAQGWGTFSQNCNGNIQRERVEVKYGKVLLSRLRFELVSNRKPSKVNAKVDNRDIKLNFTRDGALLTVVLDQAIILNSGSVLEVKIG